MTKVIEEWKDIKGYEGLYMISNLGRIKSINYHNENREELMKLITVNGGYLKIGLYKNGKHKRYFVHRLVAEAFIPNTDNKPHIDHINTLRSDNRVENLRWCTRQENINNPLTLVKFQQKMLGNGCNNKPIVQLSTDNLLLGVYKSITTAAKQLGYNNGYIGQCCNGKRTKIYGFKWKYLDDYMGDILEQIQDEDMKNEKAA